MSNSPSDRLIDAVLAVHRGEVADDLHGPLQAGELDFARILVEARRLDHEEGGCPDHARRRAHALFDQLPEGVFETLARLVLDSWQQLAPAARSVGTERLLRFEAGGAAVDVQVARDAVGGDVTLAVAVEGGGAELQARVFIDDGAVHHVTLDEHGTGSLRVGAGAAHVTLVIRDEDGDLLETPPVSLE